IRVEAQGATGGPRPMAGAGRARTGVDGAYTMELPPEQSYLIGVVDDEWAARTLGGVVVQEGNPPTALDLSRGRGSVVWGRVTVGLSDPAPGRPVMLHERGAAIPPEALEGRPFGLFDGFLRIADTDEDGRYAFRVGPGAYQITWPRGPGDRARPEDLTIVAGQEVERDYSLSRDDRPWKTVRGLVLARDGAGPPIAGAVMSVHPN